MGRAVTPGELRQFLAAADSAMAAEDVPAQVRERVINRLIFGQPVAPLPADVSPPRLKAGGKAEIRKLAERAFRISEAPHDSEEMAGELLEDLRIQVYKPARRKRWLRSLVISPYTSEPAELAEVISTAKTRLREAHVVVEREERQPACFDEHDLAAAALYEDD
jgi:hypothetical protein